MFKKAFIFVCAVLCFALVLTSCAKDKGEDEIEEIKDFSTELMLPSTATVRRTGKSDEAADVLNLFIEALRAGDYKTFSSLFVDNDPETVYGKATYAFCGPIEVWKVKISEDENNPKRDESSDVKYMYLSFWGKDTRGEFGMVEPGERDISYFPTLVRVNGVWKIQDLGGSSPSYF